MGSTGNGTEGIALVTGAARGIGNACARALAQDGHRVLMCDMRQDQLQAAADELRAQSLAVDVLAGDLGDAATLGAIADRVAAGGGLSGCVHAAGLSGTMADAALILRINLAVTARLIDTLEPLVNVGAGMVCIASQAAHLIRPAANAAVEAALDDPLADDMSARLAAAMGMDALDSATAYALSKYGVQRLVVARAMDFGKAGGRLLSLSPGVIDTDMGAQEMAAHTEAMTAIVAATPVAGRQGRPQEIAAVAAFLCSPGASFMSGSDVLVDGGSTQQLLRGGK